MHAGPLPDPETLRRYNDIITNGADRIMQMAEKEQSHRIQRETKIVDSETTQAKYGQWLAFFIVLSCVLAGSYMVINGKEAAGGIIAIGPLTVLAYTFIKGRKFQKNK